MLGLSLIDADCLKEPQTCDEKTSGPYFGPIDMEQNFLFNHAWSPNSKKIASVASYGKSVYLFDIDTRLYQKAFDVPDHVRSLAWSRDGEGLYYTTGEYYSFTIDGEIRYRNLETGEDKFFLESGLVLFTMAVE